MRATSIGTRYAAYVAALSLALVVVALVAAAAIALGQMRVVQSDLHQAVAEARAADDERALNGAATYLAVHLFNPLYQLDVERLNQEIEQTRSWLPVVSFLVLDRDGLVLTDGTAANPHYGDAAEGPLPRGESERVVVTRRGSESHLRFRVAVGGVTAGWGIVTLAGIAPAFTGLTDRPTLVPPAGAGMSSVTVNVTVPPFTGCSSTTVAVNASN